MPDKNQILVTQLDLEKTKNDLKAFPNSGELTSIKLGDTELDETNLIALLALLNTQQ